jgi:hypothetical protein
MTHRVFDKCAWLGVLVLASAWSLAAPADAADPHLVSADTTINDPVVSPGHLTWDTSLDAPFRVAGLGKNEGLTVTLNAKANIGVSNIGVNPKAQACVESACATASARLSVDLSVLGNTSAMLTSDENGNVTGTLTIPSNLSTSPITLTCAQASWTLITFTFGSQTVTLPDVLRQFDSTGSACAANPP